MFDLLLTDVRMPGMSGIELVERLAADRPRLDVVYMSGYSDESITRRILASAGPEALIEKPFDADTLIGTVRRTLAGPR